MSRPNRYTCAYFAGARTAHLVDADGNSLCRAHPRPGRRWLGDRGDREQVRLASLPSCPECRRAAEVRKQVAAWDSPAPRAGVVAVVILNGRKWPVAECADCGRVRPVHGRGLCTGCWRRHWEDGTLSEFGYTRADRFADYRDYRQRGLSITEAAERIGVTKRTAWRYEHDLREMRAAA